LCGSELILCSGCYISRRDAMHARHAWLGMLMLRARSSRALRFLRYSSSSSHQPNAPLDLDKSFRAILRDIDHSIAEQKLNRHHSPPPTHELIAHPTDSEATELVHQEDEENTRAQRKSPAAHFGSQQPGAVVLPQELKQTISALISSENVTVIAYLLFTYNV
jgi:hypothetical protein